MNKETYIELRTNFKNKLKSDDLVILMSGSEIRKSADGVYPFQANRNFVYLTGIEEPLAALIIDMRTNHEVLFLRDINPDMEKWVGRFMTKEAAHEISGIKDIRYFDEFEAYFNNVIEKAKKIGLDYDHNHQTDIYYGSGMAMVSKLSNYPLFDVFPKLVESRMIKHPDEVEAIRYAGEVTHQAILSMLEEMKPGGNERDLAACFLYEGQKRFGDLMFDTIVAGGENATVLHYIENNQKLKDKDLVLLDLGIRVNHYGADISRTFPINGKFTKRQKEVYQEVLTTFKEINENIKPGVSLATLNAVAIESLGKACIRLGLIEDVKDVGRYYYHSIGHSLGLDTHDVWTDREAALEAGNVITNEPGLYIAEEGLGIRIETDILVTKDGYEDLVPQIMIEIEEIEKYLNK